MKVVKYYIEHKTSYYLALFHSLEFTNIIIITDDKKFYPIFDNLEV